MHLKPQPSFTNSTTNQPTTMSTEYNEAVVHFIRIGRVFRNCARETNTDRLRELGRSLLEQLHGWRQCTAFRKLSAVKKREFASVLTQADIEAAVVAINAWMDWTLEHFPPLFSFPRTTTELGGLKFLLKNGLLINTSDFKTLILSKISQAKVSEWSQKIKSE